jgi:hypothetical protein
MIAPDESLCVIKVDSGSFSCRSLKNGFAVQKSAATPFTELRGKGGERLL